MFRVVPRASSEEQVARFCQVRIPQADDVYLKEWGLPADSETVRFALAVRRAVGNIGLVGPEWIRASDRYPGQLAVLPVWDSIDWVMFVMEFKEALEIQLTDSELEKVYVRNGISVAEMVQAIIKILSTRQNNLPNSSF